MTRPASAKPQKAGTGTISHPGAPKVCSPPGPAPTPLGEQLTGLRAMRREATAQYGTLARELKGRELSLPGGATRSGPMQLGFPDLQTLAEERHGLTPWELSERLKLGEARERFPTCAALYEAAVPGAARRKVLAVARSDVASEHDEILAILMLHLSVADFRTVVRSLEDPGNDSIDWELSVEPEVERLWSFACKDVCRVHGRRVSSGEVLAYILLACELGRWPEVEGMLSAREVLAGGKNIHARLSPPRYAYATLRCEDCGKLWFYDSGGRLRIPSDQRQWEILASAETITWLPVTEQLAGQGTSGSVVLGSVALGREEETRTTWDNSDGRRRRARADGHCAVGGCRESRVWNYEHEGEWVTLCPGHFRVLIGSRIPGMGQVRSPRQLLRSAAEGPPGDPLVQVAELLREVEQLRREVQQLRGVG